MSAEKTVLGIDVGSVAVSVVKINIDKQITGSGYRFHHGDIEATVTQLLERIGCDDISHVVSTNSTPSVVVAQKRYDNQIATICAGRHYHPDMKGILLVGGEKFSLSTFDDAGHYLGSVSNTSCAAGTGSFLDQQASRLKMKGIEELSATACRNNGSCPKIASRCAVFAKTDLIHAQQEGYQYEEISDGLCSGLAKNIVDTLFVSQSTPQRIIFCGGVAKNKSVVGHIEKLALVCLEVPADGHLYGAIGAVLSFIEEKNDITQLVLSSPSQIFKGMTKDRNYYYPSLQLKLSSYPDFSSLENYNFYVQQNNPVEVDIYEAVFPGKTRYFTMGVDIGSTSTKAILLDNNKKVFAGFYTRTAGRPLVAVQNIFQAIDDIARRENSTFTVTKCATTGSGRKFIGKIIGADFVIDEITAHARAAIQLNPEVDTIIEIGGQDAKFTTLKNGRVTSSTMNNVCAAGTGSFIEEIAARLGCPIEEFSARAENVKAPMASDRCTVFMERDINYHLSQGYNVNEVLASALHSVRENYLMKVASETNIGDTIYFQGATAKNKALVAAFEHRLNKPIVVSKFCHLTGAVGAALIACDEKSMCQTGFKGFSLYKKRIPIHSEMCVICANNCKITVADTPLGKVAYGFLCGRDYDTQTYVKKNTTAIDLLKVRRRLLKPKKPVEIKEDITIGLPAAVHMVDEVHFWQNFFNAIGIHTITSEDYKDGVSSGKKISKSEFCAPITAMHGHVAWLLERADVVFLPFYLENKKKDARRQYCYYTQFLPSIIATIGEQAQDRIFSPVIRYLYTSFHTKVQLYRMIKDILKRPLSYFDISKAYDTAVENDILFRQELKGVLTRRFGKNDDIEVVFVGRPYTVLSPSMNCGIPNIFTSHNIDNYFQDMLDYEEDEVKAISPLLREIHWEHGAKILEAAEVISKRKGVYPVYITSFKCSPDSFTVDYFKSVMEANNKPYLILELDEHDSTVGYETRIEAAIRSFRNHFEEESVTKSACAMVANDEIPYYRGINPQLDTHLTARNVVLPNWDRITCAFLAATLENEGFNVFLMKESGQSIQQSLKFNSGQCIPLNAVAQGYMHTISDNDLDPMKTQLWLNGSTLACNIRLYPHHIKTILNSQGYGRAGIYVGQLSFIDISITAAINAYFSYLFGGMLRRAACKIRPYEIEKGRTDMVLDKSIRVISDALLGRRSKEAALNEVITQFQCIDTKDEKRPMVAIFGDIYVRDNRVMSQDLIRYIENNGGEVMTTPYNEYAKMIAKTYFRKWFNEGKFFDVLSHKTILTGMVQLEKRYRAIFNRILDEPEFQYDKPPEEILSKYNISVENTGESMDNILKIHYIHEHHPDVSLFVQASPALCCASLITESMKGEIEKKTGVPVVSVIYDGTGGQKNSIIVPYLKFGSNRANRKKELRQQV